MSCGCSERAAGLLGKLGYRVIANEHILHRNGFSIYIHEDVVRERHFVVSLIALVLKFLIGDARTKP